MLGDRGGQRAPGDWRGAEGAEGRAARRLTHVMTTPPYNVCLKETGNHDRRFIAVKL